MGLQHVGRSGIHVGLQRAKNCTLLLTGLYDKDIQVDLKQVEDGRAL